MKLNLLATFALAFAAALLPVRAQINTGSDGHDGAFNPTQTTVIDMADHPDGIYQYTSVNIPNGVTVTFKPNANNTPVVWLVQDNVTISGTVSVSGQDAEGGKGGNGGPGGWRGGNGGLSATSGQGPGGGTRGLSGAGASFGTLGFTNFIGLAPGPIYGNDFLVPLLGGSGGGGSTSMEGPRGGGGGGGALLIAVGRTIAVNGSITAGGGYGDYYQNSGGGSGSGGGIRIVASMTVGSGIIHVGSSYAGGGGGGGGAGRVRFDIYENDFGGTVYGARFNESVLTQGLQPIILPAAGQGAKLAIASVAGNQVAASPTSQLATPDVVIPAQQANPIPVVVSCANVPLNTPITVTVKPLNGTAISAVGENKTGTLASSTAKVSLNLPRGGGLIYATATIPLGGLGAATGGGGKAASYAQTGLTTDGERFAKLEITAALGGAQQIAYVTESGKRFVLPTAGR